jgi:hypothetical protein
MLASTCPGTGVRDNLGSIIMHEFGHNLGFGHSGTASAIGAKIGSYSDGTSEISLPRPASHRNSIVYPAAAAAALVLARNRARPKALARQRSTSRTGERALATQTQR